MLKFKFNFIYRAVVSRSFGSDSTLDAATDKQEDPMKEVHERVVRHT